MFRKWVKQGHVADKTGILQAGITAKLPSLTTPYTLNRAKNLKLYFKEYHFSPVCLLIRESSCSVIVQ